MTSSEPRFSIAFRTEWLPHDEGEPCSLARLGTLLLGQQLETFVATTASGVRRAMPPRGGARSCSSRAPQRPVRP